MPSEESRQRPVTVGVRRNAKSSKCPNNARGTNGSTPFTWSAPAAAQAAAGNRGLAPRTSPISTWCRINRSRYTVCRAPSSGKTLTLPRT